MKVIVRGKNNFVPTDANVEYAEKKVAKLNQYFRDDHDLTATVLCKVYDSHQTVEITIPTKNLILRAEADSESIYSSIDLAVDKLETQITRHKSKIYKSIKQRDGVSEHYSNYTDFDIKALETEILATNLVKNKKLDLTPMSVEDAILQMEMINHDFFIFQNIDTNNVAVVYVREDGDYGIIDTNTCQVK